MKEEIKVKYKKLTPTAKAPAKAHSTDAGYDLYCSEFDGVDEYGNFVYRTGLAFEIPRGYAGFLFPRSSVARTDLVLSNCVGVVDADYRGEVLAKFKPLKSDFAKRTPLYAYKAGERICQMIVMPIPEVAMEEADELGDTDRGEGGFGSSGA